MEDDELQDVYAYALTATEEEEEERLISKFDPFDKWITGQTQQDLSQVAAVKLEKHTGSLWGAYEKWIITRYYKRCSRVWPDFRSWML